MAESRAMTQNPPPAPKRRASSPSARDGSGVSAALELCPLPAFMVDATGLLLACNDLFADAAGVPPALLAGREWWQAFAERSAAAARAALRAVVEGGEVRGTARFALVDAEGNDVGLTTNWQKLSEPGTRRLVWVFAVTQWQRHTGLPASGARLRPECATSTEIAALAAGEIASHAQDARAALDDLSRAPSLGSDAKAQEQLALARRALDRLGEVGHALRALFLPPPAFAKHVRAGDLISTALATLEPELRDRSVHVVDESRALVLRGEPDPVRVLTHVLANALRHSPREQPVTVRTYDEPGFACIEVRDRGPGLAPDILAAASGPALLAPLSSPKGAGLAIARGLARTMGGSLRIANAADGGATATLALPHAPSATTAATALRRPSAPAEAQGPLAGRRVLIVDDEPTLARALCRVVRSAGGDPLAVASVAEATEALRSQHFDAFVCDMLLPDGDGLTVAREARARAPSAPILMLTGQSAPALEELARAAGASEVLQKPFAPAALLARLSALLVPLKD